MGHVGGRGEAWPPVVISTVMVTMISTIGGHATKSASRPRASSCNGPLTTSPSPSLSHFPLLVGRDRRKKTGRRRRIVNKEDLVAEERRPEREGELLSRAPLFHVRLSSVLGTATSLTDQLTDTSTPTLTSRHLQRLPNNS